jgi:RNA polymerase sigma-70 factor, ECF subfamily
MFMDAAFGDEPVEPRGDHELVLLAQAGDMDAMVELLDRHLDYVHHLCRRILFVRADVEDARQEALLQAARKIATFNRRSSFRTWLHVVTKNVCLQAIRDRRDTFAEEVIEEEIVFDLRNEDTSVAVRVDVDAALDALSTPLRDVVMLYYFSELEQDEIAEILGITRVTVATRLYKAKQKLKPLLVDQAGPLEESEDSLAEIGASKHSAAIQDEVK